MSKITGSEVRGLMEAYGAVYTPQQLTEEQVWEEVEAWVNSLIEEGYDLSDYTWEEMYENYITERASNDPYGVSPGTPKVTSGKGPNIGKFFGFGSQAKPNQGRTNVDPYGASPRKPTSAPAAAKPTPTPAARPAASTPASPARPSGGAPRPAATPAARPSGSAPAAAKPAPSAATQTGDKAKDMATWAKANPKLAAASAERERTRGTSATTNPLMKDLKSSLPAPKAPAPSTAKTGFDLAKKGVNLAAHLDLFDIVKGHLLDEGYADTEDAAEAIMASMSEEWRASITENYLQELTVLGPTGAPVYSNNPTSKSREEQRSKQTPTPTTKPVPKSQTLMK
tara:strand:+ start:885 stop:1904 length:1020 start_codon:yes stop_codon:yes gene_type:complete